MRISDWSSDVCSSDLAITAAGAAPRLSGDHGYTLFAPTDAAFRLLPHGTIEALMHPRSRQELSGVVGAHIVPGAKSRSEIMADVQSGGGHANYRTVQGGNLRVTMEAGRIVVTDPNGRSSTVAHADRSEEHTSELQSLMRYSYAVLCLKKK